MRYETHSSYDSACRVLMDAGSDPVNELAYKLRYTSLVRLVNRLGMVPDSAFPLSCSSLNTTIA